MDKDYIIFQENGLFGAKSQTGEVIIKPQYIEMQPFSCGLSQVRNNKYHYAYVNAENKQIVPFGEYAWCDPQFVCGAARVMYMPHAEQKYWGIINRWGKVIISLVFDYIQPIKPNKLHYVKAILKGDDRVINLLALGIRSGNNDWLETELAVQHPSVYNPTRIRHSLDIGPKPKPKRQYRNIYTYDDSFDDSSYQDNSEWRELIDDVFEGDTSNYWNID